MCLTLKGKVIFRRPSKKYVTTKRDAKNEIIFERF